MNRGWRWAATVVRALGPRRDPLPTSVVLLWVVAGLLPLVAALVVATAPCQGGGPALPCRWPSTQILLPGATGCALVVAAVLATRSAYRTQRGHAERNDWTVLSWLVPVVVALGLVLLLNSYD